MKMLMVVMMITMTTATMMATMIIILLVFIEFISQYKLEPCPLKLIKQVSTLAFETCTY